MKSTTSIRSRLINGLMFIVLFFLVQAGLVWYTTSSAKTTVVESTRKNTIATSELGSLAILAQQIRRYEKEYFVYVGNKDKRDGYEREWRDTLGKMGAALGRIKTASSGAFSDKDIKQVLVWEAASTFYAAEMEKIFQAVNQRAKSVQSDKDAGLGAKIGLPTEFHSTEVNDMIKAGKDRFSAEFIRGVATMEKEKTAQTLALAKVAEEMFDQVLIGVGLTVAIGIVVALVLSITLPRTVTNTIASLSNAAETMSMGDLKQPYDSGGVIEFDTLAQALNRMRLGQQALIERLQRR